MHTICSELKVLLTENDNMHFFGLSETKLKEYKMSSTFHIFFFFLNLGWSRVFLSF